MLSSVLVILECFAIFGTQAQLSDEYLAVHWSFDISDTRIVPDIVDTDLFDTTDTNFAIDEDASERVPGFHGYGLKIKRQVELAEDVRRPCLDRLETCVDYGGGLTFAFWLKIHDLEKSVPTVFRTTNSGKSIPGMYVGKSSDSDDIEVFLFDGEAELEHTAKFKLENEIGTYIVITWTAFDGINVALNGSFLSPDGYTQKPTNVSRSGSSRSFVDLICGSSVRPVFTLDEIYVFYRVVNQSEVEYMAGVTPAAATTTMTSTTSTPETPTTLSPVNETVAPIGNATTSSTSSATPATTTTTSESVTTSTTPISTTSSPATGGCEFDFQEALEKYKENMQKWTEAFEEYQESDGEIPSC